jgi:hypothetical protein
MRELVSTPPPAVAVAIMRIGFEGNDCAAAPAVKSKDTARQVEDDRRVA